MKVNTGYKSNYGLPQSLKQRKKIERFVEKNCVNNNKKYLLRLFDVLLKFIKYKNTELKMGQSER